jgi:hypothetical protein
MHFYHIRKLAIAFMMIVMVGCASKATLEMSEAEKWEAADEAKNPILPDEDLIAAFQQHRATFELLLRMIAADSKLHRVDCDWTDPQNPKDAGVSPERISEYRQLLDEVGCHRGFEVFPARPGIYFISAAQGTVVNSLTKGFYYFEGTPDTIVTNTETYIPKAQEYSFEIFRHIDGHWYVYFQKV